MSRKRKIVALLFFLALSATGANAFDLPWGRHSDNENGFNVYRKLPTVASASLINSPGTLMRSL
jgi:hypothetical protein